MNQSGAVYVPLRDKAPKSVVFTYDEDGRFKDANGTLLDTPPGVIETGPYVQSELRGNEYYPRIHRPYSRGWGTQSQPLDPLDVPADRSTPGMGVEPYPVDSPHFESSLTQLRALIDELRELFRFVEPTDSNLETYGHKSRNLLILACTEIEAQWRGVLETNGYQPRSNKRWNTTDYVKLCDPLRLREYRVILPLYPKLPPIRPFQNWDPKDSTQSLTWYNYYNGTKHDREGKFCLGSVRQAIDSVVGCAVMLVAQYGKRLAWHEEVGECFRFDSIPNWPVEEQYIRSLDYGPTNQLAKYFVLNSNT